MVLAITLWTSLRALVGGATTITLENAALRHQLTVLQRWGRRPRLTRCQLRLENFQITPSGVRGVWLRHDLETRLQRLLRLDTFYWGTLKGVGKVYVQVVVDVFSSLAFAKVYTSKLPVTACDLLYDRVLPFYDALGVPIGAVLTDNGREFCGREDQHPYELLLALEDIQHRTTRVHTPQTNGFVERMNRTLLGECFRVAGRTTWYLDPVEIQRDLDRFRRARGDAAWSARRGGGPLPPPPAARFAMRPVSDWRRPTWAPQAPAWRRPSAMARVRPGPRQARPVHPEAAMRARAHSVGLLPAVDRSAILSERAEDA